jgi:hypothetical protein
MKPQLTFFFTDECGKCAELKPIVFEFQRELGIKLINTYDNVLITEDYGIEWVPTLVIEDENGKHKFEGVKEIKKVLYEIVSPS